VVGFGGEGFRQARGDLVEHPFISTLTRSGPVGQTILAALLVLSVYTWTLIFWKGLELRRAELLLRDFLRRFRDAAPDWLNGGSFASAPAPLASILEEGVREYRTQRELTGGRALGAEALSRIESVLEAEVSGRIGEMERGQVMLAIAASASPFMGLFGTTWGIMNAFRSMSLEGSAGIAAVAPGVAEALVTTAGGLAVAIPSVIAYNLFNRRITVLTTLLERFVAEFLRAAQHGSHREGASAAVHPQAEAAAASRPPVFARRSG
jgi:biopolymer transport protein TolQ